MSDGSAEGVLRDHARRFNHGVRAHDFTEMLELFRSDAVMTVAGVDAGPFEGRDAIAAAYRENPPSDEILLLTLNAGEDDAAADYAWRAEPHRVAGRVAIRVDGGLISQLDVTFIAGEMGDA